MTKEKVYTKGDDKAAPQRVPPALRQQPVSPEKQDGPLVAQRAADQIQTPAEESDTASRGRAMSDLQQTVGNTRISRMVEPSNKAQTAGTASTLEHPIQAKLQVGAVDDIHEKEANRMADEVTKMPETTVQRNEFAGEIRDDKLRRQDFAGEIRHDKFQTQEAPMALQQAKPAQGDVIASTHHERRQQKGERSAPAHVEATVKQVQGGGQPLPDDLQQRMESQFGADFSTVRIHADAQADSLCRDLGARAFATGSDIFFRRGEYNPSSAEGQKLLAHELWHVVQQKEAKRAQQPLQRQRADAKPRLNYHRAKQENLRLAGRLGWAARLAEMKPAWATLWESELYDAFADAVAAFQQEQGNNRHAIDGVLGPQTWDRIRPIGETIVQQRVSWEASKSVCTIAAQERLTKGYKRATGKPLIPKAEQKTVNRILQSYNLDTVDEQYRGTGAAGALVYLGTGTFVSEDEIWTQKLLRPGAALQVWGSKKEYERLRKGDDIHPFGTAAVFVAYVVKDAMKVLHFAGEETWSKGNFAVWIGANLNAR